MTNLTKDKMPVQFLFQVLYFALRIYNNAMYEILQSLHNNEQSRQVRYILKKPHF